MAHPSKRTEQRRNATYYSALGGPTWCLLPSLCGECFPGCLLPSLDGDCMYCDLGFGTHRFGFGHHAERFCKGNRPLEHLPKKSAEKCRIPNSRGHTKAWESVSPTRGATQHSVDCESLTPTQGAMQQSVD